MTIAVCLSTYNVHLTKFSATKSYELLMIDKTAVYALLMLKFHLIRFC